MSEDVIARRARALESLLGPARESLLGADQEDVETPDPREAMMVARVGALLGHPGTWQAPPPGLPEALLAEIRRPVTEPESDVEIAAVEAVAEAEPLPETPATAKPEAGPLPEPSATAMPEAGPLPEPSATAQPEAGPVPEPPVSAQPAPGPALRGRRWWPQLGWTPPRLALGVVGALAALLLVVVMFGGELLGVGRDSGRQVAEIQLAGTSAAPQAHADLRATERDAGWRLVVDIQGLAPAPPDEYYQGWAVSGTEMVPLGTFHMHEPGEVELWSGVPLKKFSRIEVTAQRVGAGQTPGVLVMVGQI
ncbi:MAG: anti-sigma factor [Actinoplanes sp.]